MSHVQLAEMFAESGLAREEMTDVVDLLLPLDDLVGEVPTPSAELEALFGEAPVGDERPTALRASRRSAVTGALVLALTGVGATGLSAAANTLPRAIQHQVSQFSQHYLPFDLPEPPPPSPPSKSMPLVTPLPTEDHGEGSASRSIPTGRPGDTSGLPAAAGGQAEPAPMAESSTLPTAAPGYAAQSAGPSPAMQPSMTGSPTPTDRPRNGPGPGGDDTGQDGKGTGHGATPAPDPDAGGNQGPGKGHDQGGKPTKPDKPNKPNKPGKPGPGGQNPVPVPTDQVPTVPQPDPQPDPDPPAPILPLPDPLPDLGPILGTGPAGDGPLGLG
jgi:hypothetical protein